MPAGFLLLIVILIGLSGCQTTGERASDDPLEERWQAADALYQQGQYEQALAVLRGILLENPKHVNAAFRSGVIHHRMGRFREAVSYYQRTVELAPGHIKAHYNLGMIYSKEMVDLGAAKTHLQRFIDLKPPPEMKTEAEKILAEVEGKLAKLQAGQGPGLGEAKPRGLREAEKESVPKLLPGEKKTASTKSTPKKTSRKPGGASSAAPETPRARARELQATAWIHKGDAAPGPDERIKAYREAVRLDPSLDEAHLKLGKAYQDRGMLAEGERALREAVRLRPASPASNEALLDVLEDRGRWNEALAAARSFVQIRPDLAWALERLGRLEERAGNARGAENAYKKALALEGSRASVHYRLGLLYDKALKIPDKASAHYRKFLELAPNVPEAKEVRKRLRSLE